MGTSRKCEALINNLSAQPGANIAAIDEIVRVSLGLFDWLWRSAVRRERMPAERERERDECVGPLVHLYYNKKTT